MTKHQKIDALPHIDRRTFIVGTAATGLVIGYAAPKIGESLAAAAANAEPSIWAVDQSGRQGLGHGRQGRHGPAHRQHHGAARRRRA